MVAFSVVIVSTSIAAIIITIPCLRDRLVEKYLEKFGNEDEVMAESTDEQDTAPKAKKKRRMSSRDLIKKAAATEESNATPEIGIEIKAMTWSKQVYKKKDTKILVLCDHTFKERDYIRDYLIFKKIVNEKKKRKT